MTNSPPQRARATNTDELSVIMSRLFTQESRQRGMSFQPHTDDIIISPYAKCGTTWLQQIAHGLRTRGSMDFEEITCVTPWLEIAYDLAWDLDAPQVASPRVYKSHL
ncbi:MAG: sulfotransferase domain-containing protein, partial [Deinococcota bacterium]